MACSQGWTRKQQHEAKSITDVGGTPHVCVCVSMHVCLCLVLHLEGLT